MARILDFAPRLHASTNPEQVLDTLVHFLVDLFPATRTYVAYHRPDAGDAIRDSLLEAERERALTVIQEVVRVGSPIVASGLPADVHGVATCVPLRDDDTSVGVLFAVIPGQPSAKADELTSYLRKLAALASVALRRTERVRALDALAAETGLDLAAGTISLSDAKRAFEGWLIRARLEDSRGNIAAAARTLMMDRGQLSRLVKRHGIDKTSYRN